MLRYWMMSVVVLALTSCKALPDWMGGAEEAPLPGERIAVLPPRSDIVPDVSLANVAVTLPNNEVNKEWLFSNYGNRFNLALPKFIAVADSYDMGQTSQGGKRLGTTPVIANNTLFVMDGGGNVSAYALDNLDEALWRIVISENKVKEGLLKALPFSFSERMHGGGGLSFADGLLFITSASGKVMAVDGKTGETVWERALNIPIASDPVAVSGMLYFITNTNQCYALEATSGRTLWSHSGIREVTGILGSASPAISREAVIVPYSSGELYALERRTGKVLWSDVLTKNVQGNSQFSFSDIDATPVTDQTRIYAVGHEGTLSALEARSGRSIWEQGVTSIKTPWLAGNWLFVLSTNDELIAVHAPDGRVKWVTPLPAYEDPEDRKHKIVWSAPIVAGDKLITVGSYGELLVVSPFDGSVEQRIEIPKPIYLPPIVADNTLYLLSEGAELTVLH